jgi:hypothetical protein
MACEARRKSLIHYRNMKDQETTRTPPGCSAWSTGAFRTPLDAHDPVHPERNLEHYITQIVGMADE